MMEYNSLLDLVKHRRSCRLFKAEQLPDETIRKILDAARWAPSGANTQPWDFIVIRDIQTKRKIAGFIDEHGSLTHQMELTRDPARRLPPGLDLDNPALIVVCADPRTIHAYPLYTVYQRGQSNLDSSLAGAFLYMHLAATCLGLGSRWISATRNYYVQCLMKNLLDIPDELEIYDTMAVGFPESEPGDRTLKNLDEIIHYERYNRALFKTDEEIKSSINSRRAR